MDQKELKVLLKYNPETGHFTRNVRAGRYAVGTVAGSKGRDGINIRINKKSYLAHRLVYLYVHGSLPTGNLVHLNNDKLDNRLSNISISTASRVVPKELTIEELSSRLVYNSSTGLFIYVTGSNAGATAGHVSPQGYRAIKVLGKSYFAHRLAWFYMSGTWPKGQIDHIDRDKDNNSWDNLRDVTAAQNAKNKSIPKNNTSGTVGVTSLSAGKWLARITADGVPINLGTYMSKCEAIAARRAAELKYGFYNNIIEE